MIKIYVDGGSRGNPGPSAYGVVIEGRPCRGGFIGYTTNNNAEWIAMLNGLAIALSRRYQDVIIYSDSKLVIEQIKGNYAINIPEFKKYKEIFLKGVLGKKINIKLISREKNKADIIVNRVLDALTIA